MSRRTAAGARGRGGGELAGTRAEGNDHSQSRYARVRKLAQARRGGAWRQPREGSNGGRRLCRRRVPRTAFPWCTLLAETPAEAADAVAAETQAASSPAEQAARSGASGGVAASAAPKPAGAKTHEDVAGWEALANAPVKLRVIDAALSRAAQCAADAAAATDPARRAFFQTQETYFKAYPAAVISEQARIKAGDGKRFPRADLKAAEKMDVPASSVGAVPGTQVCDLFDNRGASSCAHADPRKVATHLRRAPSRSLDARDRHHASAHGWH